MARKITFMQAINEALDQEMERDETVVIFGEDVAGGSGSQGEEDAWGGVMGVTKGLYHKFPGRVLDTPITESSFIGAAGGAAASGLRPVAELMFNDFMGVCFDQIYNQSAKFRYMFGGRAETPMVIRTMYGAGIRAAAQHSQSLYPIFTHIPGLKVAIPSNPYDAKGLLIASIRDNDPVIFFENKVLYAEEGEVPEDPYVVPLGEAEFVREGDDVTIVAIGRMVSIAEQAAEAVADEGIECEIVDPRTTSPLDEETIYESVEHTGRLVVVDEANPRCSVATDITALVAQNCFEDLKSAPRMVTAPHTPVPFSPTLEDLPGPGEGSSSRTRDRRNGRGVLLSETSQISKLGMPKWGLSMTEGTVIQWLVEEGAELEAGDEVVEVESEKINNVVEAPASGVLRRRVANEGDEIPVGGLLGVIAAPDVPDEEIDSYVQEFQETFVPEEEEVGPEPEIVEVNGKSIQYLRVGEGGGDPVLLHGFGGDINIWIFNQETLAAEHTVYALDLPGHGASTKEVGDGDLDYFVGVVADFLDAMEVEKAHLVGHSMGGAIAGAFAKAHPDRVASLILIDSAGLGPEINEEYIEGFIAANRRREMKKTLEMLFADPDLVTRQLVRDVMKFKRVDGVDEALRTVADKVFPDGHQADVPDLSEISIPILTIWGSEDQIIPASHTESLPSEARVEVLEESGHMPQMEAAGKVNRLIGEFLESVES